MTIGKPFQKGRSGNPGGRPKVVAEVKELARAHTDKAIETLVSIMDNPKAAPVARVSAANALLDRGYGKPPQHISGEGGPSYVVRLPEPCKIFPWSHLTIGTDMGHTDNCRGETLTCIETTSLRGWLASALSRCYRVSARARFGDRSAWARSGSPLALH
jgi:uncharacterized protein DUF5681